VPNLVLDSSTIAVIASELSKQSVANGRTAQERDIVGNARRVVDAEGRRRLLPQAAFSKGRS
jgi:hypothetical protein